jgi:hypothetical protein
MIKKPKGIFFYTNRMPGPLLVQGLPPPEKRFLPTSTALLKQPFGNMRSDDVGTILTNHPDVC